MVLKTSNLKLQTSVVVLGLGNPLMADEGVGVAVIERLVSLEEPHPDVEFIDAGTGGMAILHYIEGRDKAIFVDCAAMGEPPGTIRRFTPQQVRNTKQLAHQSLHEADLLRILGLAEQLGRAPRQVVIFGIEPEQVAPRWGLSKTVEDRMEHYISLIRSELHGNIKNQNAKVKTTDQDLS